MGTVLKHDKRHGIGRIPMVRTVFKHTEATCWPAGATDAVGGHCMSVSVAADIACTQSRGWSFIMKTCTAENICLLTRLGTKISGRSHIIASNCIVSGSRCFAVRVTLEALDEVDDDQQRDNKKQVPQTGHRFRVKLRRKQCAPVACGVYICRDNKHAHFVMLHIYILKLCAEYHCAHIVAFHSSRGVATFSSLF